MSFVVDNSVVMAWCFEDEATSYTESVLDHLQEADAFVPAIWPFEVANALLMAERRRRMTEAQAAHYAALLQSLPIVVEDIDPTRVLSSVLSVGRAHRLSAYDAAYLELAARRGVPLATQDAHVRLAARNASIAILQ